jgi:hypothetical protein
VATYICLDILDILDILDTLDTLPSHLWEARIVKALRLSEAQYLSLKSRGKDTKTAKASKDAKPAKYRNVRTGADGITFDSAKEARRWQELRLLVMAGQISGLQRQTKFPLVVGGIDICSYIADFSYVANGELVVEDVKSEVTRKLPVYRIKCRLMLALHGVEILET